MAFESVYFSLGSNLGDREANIFEALRRLDGELGVHYSALSRLLETSPMGFSGDMFLNAAVLYRIPRPAGSAEEAALGLLAKIKGIERAMGRCDLPEYDSGGGRIYHSRIIDIDILFYGKERVDVPGLDIPHKGMEDRPFVMLPLREIAKPALRRAFPEYFRGLPSDA